jgi:hypothetical protein
MNKKPNVVAKTARKVRLNATQVKFAKDNDIPLADFAKSVVPKRGRPVGSKNKPKPAPKKPVQNKVNWQDLAKRLQEALMKEMKDNEAALEKLHKYAGIEHHVDFLEKQVESYKQMMLEQRGIIGYLEGKLKKAVEDLDGYH